LGGHPDRRVICPQRGPGILEIKTADWLVRKQWGDEPPAHYLFRARPIRASTVVAWGDVLVLVGGNKLERFCYDFRPKIYAEIERRVADFWRSVEANDPPPADYARDLDTISALYREGTDDVVDLTADNLAHEAAAAFLFAKEARLEAEKKRTPPRPSCWTSWASLRPPRSTASRSARRLLPPFPSAPLSLAKSSGAGNLTAD
jgi:predicted phage-related endonuclease